MDLEQGDKVILLKDFPLKDGSDHVLKEGSILTYIGHAVQEYHKCFFRDKEDCVVMFNTRLMYNDIDKLFSTVKEV